jgi:hypothetical protein
MTSLVVWTARLGSRRWPPFREESIGSPRRPLPDSEDAPDLNVTRKSGTVDGLPFAPSWDLVEVILRARKLERHFFLGVAHGTPEWDAACTDARRIEESAWEQYVPAYLTEMRASYRRDRAGWDRLLARPRVVLLCYCPNATRCHRTVLARDILQKLGVLYGGELVRPKEERAAEAPITATDVP